MKARKPIKPRLHKFMFMKDCPYKGKVHDDSPKPAYSRKNKHKKEIQ